MKHAPKITWNIKCAEQSHHAPLEGTRVRARALSLRLTKRSDVMSLNTHRSSSSAAPRRAPGRRGFPGKCYESSRTTPAAPAPEEPSADTSSELTSTAFQLYLEQFLFIFYIHFVIISECSPNIKQKLIV